MYCQKRSELLAIITPTADEAARRTNEYQDRITVKDVRSFMGYVNFYRSFARNLSTVAKPLFDLTNKSSRFKWESKHQEAFEAIKKILAEDIHLMFPKPDQTFYLYFDSSNLGTGAVLQQLDDKNRLRPLEFYSKKWNAAEYNYATPDKELYGLVLALKHWYPWLYSAKEIVVYTDHKSLRDFSKTQLLKPRHARWALVLEDYRGRLKVKWIPGKTNLVADALSRNPTFQLNEKEMKERVEHTVIPPDAFTESFPTPHELKVLQELDESGNDDELPISPIANITTNGHATSQDVTNEIDESDDRHGSLRHCQAHQKDVTDDKDLQTRILELYHDHPLAGHYGYGGSISANMSRTTPPVVTRVKEIRVRIKKQWVS
ncbi:hypothetical protein SeMB42_g02155 [Synchytrium endobioticum]|uniref:Reverse transcriptase RNase H-like domain-containing protein n=1 Tax=Synchytrium endobioticum TaxID=286115 RepID=A0A507DIQ8_9FUNG|nr:hypothetical protein SeMB42_g02155 [Synchytrium endobioticum]